MSYTPFLPTLWNTVSTKFTEFSPISVGAYNIYDGALRKFTAACYEYDTSSTYVVNEYCYYTSAGTTNYYKANQAITTPEAFTPAHWDVKTTAEYMTDTSNSVTISSQFGAGVSVDYAPVAEAYDISTSYGAGKMVINDGKLYRANEDTTAGAFDPAKWTQINVAGKMIAFNDQTNDNIAPIYSTAGTYDTGAIVVYANPASQIYKLYRAKEDGVTGDWDSTKWDEIAVTDQLFRFKTNQVAAKISPATVYSVGDYATWQDELYKVTTAIPAYDASAGTYAVGDYVEQGGKFYCCNTAITTPEIFDDTKWDEKTNAEMIAACFTKTTIMSQIPGECLTEVATPWTSTGAYYKKQIVQKDGITYKCIVDAATVGSFISSSGTSAYAISDGAATGSPVYACVFDYTASGASTALKNFIEYIYYQKTSEGGDGKLHFKFKALPSGTEKEVNVTNWDGNISVTLSDGTVATFFSQSQIKSMLRNDDASGNTVFPTDTTSFEFTYYKEVDAEWEKYHMILADQMAPYFSTTSDYSTGDIVLYNGMLLRAVNDITAGTFNPSDWEYTTIAENFNEKAWATFIIDDEDTFTQYFTNDTTNGQDYSRVELRADIAFTYDGTKTHSITRTAHFRGNHHYINFNMATNYAENVISANQIEDVTVNMTVTASSANNVGFYPFGTVHAYEAYKTEIHDSIVNINLGSSLEVEGTVYTGNSTDYYYNCTIIVSGSGDTTSDVKIRFDGTYDHCSIQQTYTKPSDVAAIVSYDGDFNHCSIADSTVTNTSGYVWLYGNFIDNKINLSGSYATFRGFAGNAVNNVITQTGTNIAGTVGYMVYMNQKENSYTRRITGNNVTNSATNPIISNFCGATGTYDPQFHSGNSIIHYDSTTSAYVIDWQETTASIAPTYPEYTAQAYSIGARVTKDSKYYMAMQATSATWVASEWKEVVPEEQAALELAAELTALGLTRAVTYNSTTGAFEYTYTMNP